MRLFPNCRIAIGHASDLLRDLSHTVHPGHWQGLNVASRPEAQMREILNHSFQVSLGWCEDLGTYQRDIEPNLPWADRHFEDERVSGQPINPGDSWKTWPFGNSADKFRDENGGQFNHSYAERYWPRFAGRWENDGPHSDGHHGIRYRYADLNDLVNQLAEDPLTRQAYLPVWFPEDGSHRDRKPCTLGYHFIMRNETFQCTYYIRSCDFFRHFRDDIYLTIRLQLWVLQQLRLRDPKQWETVKAGMFTMHIVSLHLFRNDYLKLFGKDYK